MSSGKKRVWKIGRWRRQDSVRPQATYSYARSTGIFCSLELRECPIAMELCVIPGNNPVLPSKYFRAGSLLTLAFIVSTVCSFAEATPRCGQVPAYGSASDDASGSTYIPVDSWIYDAVVRLQGLGYVDTAYLGIRPWTRLSLDHIVRESSSKISDAAVDGEACIIYRALLRELEPEPSPTDSTKRLPIAVESVYQRALGIAGTPLRDSFHAGQTIINDYGRPYQEGFNSLSGFSMRGEKGRFSLYFRGEYQHAPAAAGYSSAISSTLANIDEIPLASNPRQATLPAGPILETNAFRVVEANVSYHLLNHEVSFGKNDHWLGPAKGASFAWSNNAENIYAFQIDRVEPLQIPFLSRLTGAFRYEFFVGSLKGHTAPNAPWIHAEKISFKPTENLELGFERSVIWGGEGHVPITLHSFLKSFFSFQNVSGSEKLSRSDPGARFGTFDFSYRLPFLRRWVTLYSDSLAHDDVSPASAPRRAGIRPGLYLSHLPAMPRFDLRAEAVTSDPPTSRSTGGAFLYAENVQKQGYTNKGFILGDWIGRESKGGQAWLTYHLTPKEYVQLSYRTAKAAKDFIPEGTTQHDADLEVVKRVRDVFEIKSMVQYEQWKAPLLQPGLQRNLSVSGQITWFPKGWRF